MAGQDLLGRLADLSEDALSRLSDAPGADKALAALKTMRERLDDLQKRVRGLEELEGRLTALERKVDKLSKGLGAGGASTPSSARKATSTKSSGGTSSNQQGE
jgi:phage shock protein A